MESCFKNNDSHLIARLLSLLVRRVAVDGKFLLICCFWVLHVIHACAAGIEPSNIVCEVFCAPVELDNLNFAMLSKVSVPELTNKVRDCHFRELRQIKLSSGASLSAGAL